MTKLSQPMSQNINLVERTGIGRGSPAKGRERKVEKDSKREEKRDRNRERVAQRLLSFRE